ncbi:unnamed protein product, partial [Pelagomonas calceolata]
GRVLYSFRCRARLGFGEGGARRLGRQAAVAELVQRGLRARVRGGHEVVEGLLVVLLDAPPLLVHGAELGLRVGVARVRRAHVPPRRLGVVDEHAAAPVLVAEPEPVLHVGVALVGRAHEPVDGGLLVPGHALALHEREPVVRLRLHDARLGGLAVPVRRRRVGLVDLGEALLDGAREAVHGHGVARHGRRAEVVHGQRLVHLAADARLEQQPEREPRARVAAGRLVVEAHGVARPHGPHRRLELGRPRVAAHALALHEDRREVRRAERVAELRAALQVARRLGVVDALAEAVEPAAALGEAAAAVRLPRGRAVDAHGPARTSTVHGAFRRRVDGDAGSSPLDRCPFVGAYRSTGTHASAVDGTYTGIEALMPASAATGTAFDTRPAPVRGAYRSTDAGSSPLDGVAMPVPSQDGRVTHWLISTRARTGARRRERAPPARAAPARARRGLGP